jgi:hypothetical protein
VVSEREKKKRAQHTRLVVIAACHIIRTQRAIAAAACAVLVVCIIPSVDVIEIIHGFTSENTRAQSKHVVQHGSEE